MERPNSNETAKMAALLYIFTPTVQSHAANGMCSHNFMTCALYSRENRKKVMCK